MSDEIPEDVMKAANAAFADAKVVSASLVADDEDSDVRPLSKGTKRYWPKTRAELVAEAIVTFRKQIEIAMKPKAKRHE